jgi:hypothetical protein
VIRLPLRLASRHGVRLAAIGLGVAALFAADHSGPTILTGGLTSRAEAVVGRPLTPLSYAGVARRTTRRALADPYVAAPYVAAPRPGCVRVVDPYGRVVWRCV